MRSDAGRKGREDERELDDVTLARAQRAELEALRALVERYQATVFAYLGRMLLVDRDHAAVKDLAQETMVRVVQRLAEFQPNGPARLSTWILTIATNLAIDELRRRKRRRGTGLVDAAELVSADGERPDRIAARRDRSRRSRRRWRGSRPSIAPPFFCARRTTCPTTRSDGRSASTWGP